jgi:Mrp family chromosome partitioning ATPase
MSMVDQAFIKAFATVARDRGTVATGELARTRPDASQISSGALLSPDPVGDRQTRLDALDLPSPAPNFSPAARPDDVFRALLEIDRVTWPAASLELVERARREWDQFTAHLIERMGQSEKRIALAGTAHGDGTTTIALAIARHVAARGMRPLVVDADSENPELASLCGVLAQTGWDDVVCGELAPGEALITAVEDGVTLLPWRARGGDLAKAAAAPRASEVFATLDEHYDLLVLDALPLVDRTAIASFAALAGAVRLDALYLIHNVRTTSREQLSALCARIRDCGLPLAAVIENFVAPNSAPAPSARAFHTAGRARIDFE